MLFSNQKILFYVSTEVLPPMNQERQKIINTPVSPLMPVPVIRPSLKLLVINED